jgi:hypothetical protein
LSRYEELIPSWIEQTNRGLKPRGRCVECGRELALRKDNTVGPHKRLNRQGRPGDYPCLGGNERSMNLTIDRVRPDLDLVETKQLVRVVEFALNSSAFSLLLDADKEAVLRRALGKLNDPASRVTLTRTEEAQMFKKGPTP